jgi:hypothetical protein
MVGKVDIRAYTPYFFSMGKDDYPHGSFGPDVPNGVLSSNLGHQASIAFVKGYSTTLAVVPNEYVTDPSTGDVYPRVVVTVDKTAKPVLIPNDPFKANDEGYDIPMMNTAPVLFCLGSKKYFPIADIVHMLESDDNALRLSMDYCFRGIAKQKLMAEQLFNSGAPYYCTALANIYTYQINQVLANLDIILDGDSHVFGNRTASRVPECFLSNWESLGYFYRHHVDHPGMADGWEFAFASHLDMHVDGLVPGYYPRGRKVEFYCQHVVVNDYGAMFPSVVADGYVNVVHGPVSDDEYLVDPFEHFEDVPIDVDPRDPGGVGDDFIENWFD